MFDTLFEQLRVDPSKYEIKIALIERLMPLMNKNQAETFMKIIENVISLPADKSIFKHNINPLRLSLLLYKTINDVSMKFNYSDYTTNSIKESIQK